MSVYAVDYVDIFANEQFQAAFKLIPYFAFGTFFLALTDYTTLQYHLLLVLWKVYLENLGYNEGNFITKGDLIDKIKSYELILTRTELNAAFRLFKKYSLINFDDDEDGEDMKIQLYPSLQFGWDLPQFQAVVKEYLKEEPEETEEEKQDFGEQIYPEDFEEDGE